jgi:uncharacterized protein YceK
MCIKSITLSVLLMLTMACSGCAEIATNVIVSGGMQYAQEKHQLENNKAISRCNMFNVVKGNKLCRIHRQYRRV